MERRDGKWFGSASPLSPLFLLLLLRFAANMSATRGPHEKRPSHAGASTSLSTVAPSTKCSLCTHTLTHTHAHTHTGDVTKRCDCPGRITRGRAHSAGERDMNTRAHARTHDTCTMHTAGFLLFLSPFCFVGPQRTWNFQGAPPLPLSPADDAPYSRQSPAGGVRVLSVPGRS